MPVLYNVHNLNLHSTVSFSMDRDPQLTNEVYIKPYLFSHEHTRTTTLFNPRQKHALQVDAIIGRWIWGPCIQVPRNDLTAALWNVTCNMTPRRSVLLHEGWAFRQTDDPDSKYLKTHGFPTEIHLDLMHHGLIPNPVRGKNENDVQWVGERSWTYRTTFSSPEVTYGDIVVLIFDGLDTCATVQLNGTELLKTNNMFIPERVNVMEKLLPGGRNDLEITFDSAWLRGKKIVEQYPDHLWGCWNGDPSRLAVRKAQYHYVYRLYDSGSRNL